MSRSAGRRPLWIGLSIVVGVLLVVETAALFSIINGQGAIGTDLQYYRFVADRWLTTGVWYTPEQLNGPYIVQTQVHNLYPPTALYLFVPFTVLPAVLWWAIPLGILAYVIWWCRPQAWAWPLLMLVLLFPKTPAQILFGNTDMWLAAFIAGGIRWSWPAVLVSIKPSLAFFAAIGIRDRSWWIAVLVLAVLSLPLLSYWLQWPVITRNSSAQFYYSFGNLPFFLLPILAWAVSSRRGDIGIGPWLFGVFGRRSALLSRTASLAQTTDASVRVAPAE